MDRKKKLIILAGACLLLLIVAVVLLVTIKPGPAAGSSADTTTTQDADATNPDGSPNPDGTNPSATNPNATNPDGSPNPVNPGEEQEGTTSAPTDEPPVVVIPPEDQEKGLEFPFEIPGHDLVIEKLAPYEGLFVEDGTNRQVSDVAMLMVRNLGSSAVEYTEIVISFEDAELAFHISMLPAESAMVAQEVSGQSIPQGVPQQAQALVVHREQVQIPAEITVTDNGDDSLTITNLTDQTLPTVRVFYKYYMENEDLYIGGIAFTIRITNVDPNASVVVRPSHYLSASSRVVMGQIYDTDR